MRRVNFQGKPTVFLGPFPLRGTQVPLRPLLGPFLFLYKNPLGPSFIFVKEKYKNIPVFIFHFFALGGAEGVKRPKDATLAQRARQSLVYSKNPRIPSMTFLPILRFFPLVSIATESKYTESHQKIRV